MVNFLKNILQRIFLTIGTTILIALFVVAGVIVVVAIGIGVIGAVWYGALMGDELVFRKTKHELRSAWRE